MVVITLSMPDYHAIHLSLISGFFKCIPFVYSIYWSIKFSHRSLTTLVLSGCSVTWVTSIASTSSPSRTSTPCTLTQHSTSLAQGWCSPIPMGLAIRSTCSTKQAGQSWKNLPLWYQTDTHCGCCLNECPWTCWCWIPRELLWIRKKSPLRRQVWWRCGYLS